MAAKITLLDEVAFCIGVAFIACAMKETDLHSIEIFPFSDFG
jgi:hypothetical protein